MALATELPRCSWARVQTREERTCSLARAHHTSGPGFLDTRRFARGPGGRRLCSVQGPPGLLSVEQGARSMSGVGKAGEREDLFSLFDSERDGMRPCSNPHAHTRSREMPARAQMGTDLTNAQRRPPEAHTCMCTSHMHTCAHDTRGATGPLRPCSLLAWRTLFGCPTVQTSQEDKVLSLSRT